MLTAGMCGRFVQVEKPEFYARHFSAEFVRTETLRSNYNVAPTSQVYAIAEYGGDRVVTSLRWGLIPAWAKEKKIGGRAFNARSESAAEKPTFRTSFSKQRCILPLDGFYEWERTPKGKAPHYIYSVEGGPLAAAGLWSSWNDPESGERLLSCAILTGPPNSLLEGVHDRMPVLLTSGQWDAWLDPSNNDEGQIRSLIDVYPSELMAKHRVSTLVNRVQNNSAHLVKALDTPEID